MRASGVRARGSTSSVSGYDSLNRLPLTDVTLTVSGSTSRRHADLIGRPAFWAAALVTLGALVVWAFWRIGRLWLGASVLLMWSLFSAVNAVRCGRIHSIVTAPVYLLGAAAMGLHALRVVDARGWLPWLLVAGLVLAHVAERRFGRYRRARVRS
jgi:hypothetical protein